jgi:hypothetical protein
MLPEKKDLFCFRCHGHIDKIEKSMKEGILSRDVRMIDIQREFEKPYHHPIEKTGVHRYNEDLPEKDSSKPRHSECVDCHNAHFVSKDKSLLVNGYSIGRAKVNEIRDEYELCFKCHSDSANRPGNQKNKIDEFHPSNRSYHPIVAPGKNSRVPSLAFSLTPSSMIKCTDCHNNDDPSGPKGPHGSMHRYILIRNFSLTDGPEGETQYALCYGCHRRESILSNESFPYHREHIVNASTSCRTCHNPHGSKINEHLIDLDNLSIRPTRSGRLQYITFGPRSGQCYLNCHGKEHDPATYPTGILEPLRRLRHK